MFFGGRGGGSGHESKLHFIIDFFNMGGNSGFKVNFGNMGGQSQGGQRGNNPFGGFDFFFK